MMHRTTAVTEEKVMNMLSQLYSTTREKDIRLAIELAFHISNINIDELKLIKALYSLTMEGRYDLFSRYSAVTA